jgi:fatty acid desaturase
MSNASPMSFTVVTAKAVNFAKKYAAAGIVQAIGVWTLVVLWLVTAWSFLVVWYIVVFGFFGLLAFPYRMIRRRQRNNDAKHQELIAALKVHQ